MENIVKLTRENLRHKTIAIDIFIKSDITVSTSQPPLSSNYE